MVDEELRAKIIQRAKLKMSRSQVLAILETVTLLEYIEELESRLTPRAPDLAESCAWKCHGRSDEICNHCTQYNPPSG